MNKQVRIKFKGRDLSRTVVRNNILRVYNNTSEEDRYDWYSEAYKWGISCLIAANLDASDYRNINKICGVIAALSPVKTWRDNKKLALDMLLTNECGHMKQFKDKARKILCSDGEEDTVLKILNGKKIKSFFLNVRKPHDGNLVTIDRHALRVALNEYVIDKVYQGMTDNQYDFFVDCYKAAAERSQSSPLLVQSATWVYLRNNKDMFNN